MLDVVSVDDPDDPRIADFVSLRDRRDNDVVIVEGHTAVDELAQSDYPIRAVLCLPKKLDRVVSSLRGKTPPVYLAEEPVLRATVGFDLHRGAIASADRIAEPDVATVLRHARTIVIAEGLNDHENLGSLFRNARGLGADAILLDPQTADPLYRRAVRVSMGNVLRLPFARLHPWPDALATVVADAGFTIVALTPGGDVDLHAADLGHKVAVLVGTEGPGLTDDAIAHADVRARIEMAQGVDSLNVATATAIALYEARSSTY
jgi:tRNA G18 (ribose-2'-O)-methylase SpoU